MSQIDQAFIHAFATPRQPSALPAAGQVPLFASAPMTGGGHTSGHASGQPGGHFVGHPGIQQSPHVRIDPVPTAAQPSYAASRAVSAGPWEPVPTPHFHVAQAQPASPVAAPVVAPVAAPIPQARSASPPVAPPTGPPHGERRPLSTFASPEPTTVFDPVFEVDRFRWPQMTGDLLHAYHELFIPVADQLVNVSEQGRKLIGFAGTRPNVGCSTLLMCLARLIASIGKSVALVDANFSKARLGRDLGFQFETGWEDALTGRLPLAECVVKSLEDRIALLPLARPQANPGELLNTIQTSVSAGVLRYHYDVVLFNLGDAAVSPQCFAAHSILEHCRLDATMIVADSERTGIDSMDALMTLLGPTCLGVIGNSAN